MAEAYAEEPQAAAAEETSEAAGGGGGEGGPTDLLLLKKAERRRQRDLYTALNLEEGASAEDVRGAYLRLAALMHPDKHGGGSALRADAEEVGLFFCRSLLGIGVCLSGGSPFDDCNHTLAAIPAHRPRVQGADGPAHAAGLRPLRGAGEDDTVTNHELIK